MIDPTPLPSPLPWPFKGQGWVFLLSPICSSPSGRPRPSAYHPGTKGQLVGGPGSLNLYRYTDSPFGPYDELSYSPGWYEYLGSPGTKRTSKASRITKSYVSCSDRSISIIRKDCGIPAERAEFAWYSPRPGEVIVNITLPNGQHVTELLLQQTSFPIFTINSRSIMTDNLDLARYAPIVQPLLDGNQVPAPREIEPYSLLLASAPLLKSYTSVYGSSGIAKLVRAVTNAEFFPVIEEAGISRYGLALTEMDMILHPVEVVLDVIRPKERGWQRSGTIWDWFKSVIFEKQK
jgi:hypothetical protein